MSSCQFRTTPSVLKQQYKPLLVLVIDVPYPTVSHASHLTNIHLYHSIVVVTHISKT